MTLRGRIRTSAFAVIMAIGIALPSAHIALADATTPAPTTTSSSADAGGFSISVETVEQLTGLTAVVAARGESVNLRAAPGNNSESLTSIPDGTVIDLRVDRVDTVLDESGVRWWPVVYEDQDGWISGEFLTQATTSEGDIVSPSLIAFEYSGTIDQHSTARVFGNGQQVNVRAEPTATSQIVTKAADGQIVSLRIDLVDTVYDDANTRWWPVVVNGEEGWISGNYLTDSNGATTTQPGETPATAVPTATVEPTVVATAPATVEATAPGDGAFSAGEFAQIFTGEGGTVNVRDSGSPDGTVVDSLDDGDVVEIVSGPIVNAASSTVWYEVRNASASGFVNAELLISSVVAPGTEAPVSTEPPLSEEEEATVAATQTPAPTETPVTPQPTTPPATQSPPTQAPATQAPATQAPATEEANAQFIYPLASYTRTQGFGCSSLGFYSYNAEWGCAVHNGLDLAAPSGTPILASAGGTVVAAGWCNCGLGYYVEIDHGNGFHTLYGHMASQPYVSVGQQVDQGETIGPVGSTGISTGPHVHFMIRIDGDAVNPEDYL
jgi:murein DD-endopeptidase MepM/ murein hydrolase activator NlpD